MKSKYKVFVDIDGTLDQFDKGAAKILGKPFTDSEEDWKAIKAFNDKTPFYETLPLMPGAEKLVRFILEHFSKVTILTVNNNDTKNEKQEKTNWIHNHFGSIPIKFAKSGKLKAFYANPYSILIDNEEDNIKSFKKVGGIGILFKNTEATIEELKNYL